MNRAIFQWLGAWALLGLAVGPARGQTQFTRQFGTSSQDYVSAVALDGTGVYAGGYSYALLGQTSTGYEDAFVRKYDPNGNLLWTRQFGTSSYDHVNAVASDGTGVYVGGSTGGALPGQTSAGYEDAFVRKYDTAGNLQWTRQFGTSSFEHVFGAAVDGTGVYVGGYTASVLPGQASAGGLTDAFVQKYDVNGNLLWTRQFGTSSYEYAYSVAVDVTGVYVGGYTGGTIPGQTGAGFEDAFVRKYDADGNLLWTRQFGASGYEYVYGVATDGTGVYAGGYTDGALPGQTSAGYEDAFVRKYDTNGNLLWTRQFGTSSYEYAYGVAVDSTGVYVGGSTGGVLPGQIGVGIEDAFVRKYDTQGNLQWTRQFGTSGFERAYGVAVNGTGVYAGGSTGGALPGQISSGSADAFLLRLDTLLPALRFIPVTPCRVVDTRPGQGTSGPFGPPALLPDQTRIFSIRDGKCGIPAQASAYSLNVTVIPQEPLAYLSLWPAGQPRPLVSTLNSFHGGVVANAAIAPAGTNGAISVYVTNRTELVIDTNGYFTAEANSQALSFYALDPCRTVDTRSFYGAFGPPSLGAGAGRSFPLPNASCRIPTWAAAHSLNATVVPQGALGYLTLWPTGQPQPFVSTLNSFDGTVVANAAIVPAGTSGSISAFATDKTDLILDTNGFFGTPGNAGERTFKPVTPCRIADTRLDGAGGQMFGGETRNFTVSGKCGVPAEAKAYALNVTVVPEGRLSYLSLWPAGTTQPVVSTLNSHLGRVVANAALVPAGTNGVLSVYVTNTTHVILDINGYFY